MPRALRKGPFCDPSTLHVQSGAMIWSRRSMILPQHVGLSLRVHTGKSFLDLLVEEDMVGHKFGEFASTRKKVIHKKKTKKK